MEQIPESLLFMTLEGISKLVMHSRNPQQTLSNIVHLLAHQFGTEVCSVYLLEPRSRQLVLAETVGLKPDCVGQIRMRLDEGLTGLVAQEGEPVVVKEASSHPRFKFFPEAGEEQFHSYWGVPLLDGGEVIGVLALQTVQPRECSDNVVRMLITAASQLSPLVGEAWLLKQLEAPATPESRAHGGQEERVLRGTSLSPGVGVGGAYWAQKFDWDLLAHQAGAQADEQQRLIAAMERARQDTERVSQRIADLVGEDQGAILQAQLMILRDTKIEEDLAGFLGEGASAEAAAFRTVDKYSRAFAKLDSPYFRERLYDIKDVFRRILWHLQPAALGPGTADQRLVLVGAEASVAELFSVDVDQVAGVIVEHGGRTSHAAILARSLGIPMLAQVPNLAASVRAGARLLVDGDRGQVIVQPPDALLAEFRSKLTARVAVREKIGAAPPAPVSTAPAGPAVEANINLVSEVPQAMAHGAAGVGLYRTEFLILSRRAMVSEEQQYRNYCQLLTLLKGRPANIRTFDLRAEKAPPPSADQPDPGSLDWRLVLRSPAVQRVFRQQVRAILRAGVVGPVRILVPLIVSSEQLAWVKATVAEAREELQREGLPCVSQISLGIMIEVPVAVTMVEEWTGQVDFVCLGTNDLLASAMGVSRDDPVSEIVCDPLHPGLLRMVRHVITACRAAGKPVTVCGEMAVSPGGASLLADMGADAVSVAVERIPQVRAALADWTAPR